MGWRARVSYGTFKIKVSEAITEYSRKHFPDKKEGRIENEKDYKIAVGKLATDFKDTKFGLKTHVPNEWWKKWLDDIRKEFEVEIWETISSISSSKISDLKTKGEGKVEYAYALHYRLHCEFHRKHFAAQLDHQVFGAPYEAIFHVPVFEGIPDIAADAPTAPFSHPPYHLYDEVEDVLKKSPANGIWLDPHNHHSLPLSSRDVEKETLTEFIEASAPFLIQPLIGPSGAGKTRLVSQWMRPYVPSFSNTEWDAGFVDSSKLNSRDALPWAGWQIKRPTLIVIDYTFAYDDVVRQIAECARRNPTSHKIRLLVIDHIYPKFLQDDHFWSFAFGSPQQLNVFEQTIIRPPIELTPVGTESNLLREVIAASASLGRRRFTADDPDVVAAEKQLIHMGESSKENDPMYMDEVFEENSYGNPDAVRHPLFAALLGQAMRGADGKPTDFWRWTRRDLITYYFSGENRLPWTVWEGKRGLTVGALVSAATLRRGLPIYEDIRDRLGDKADSVIDYANRVVSSDNRFVIKPFLPDILGEAFLLKFLNKVEKNKVASAKFISLLENVGEDRNVADNFQETIIRLVRNLANDDQALREVQDGWRVLAKFLNPERFPAGSDLRRAISLCIADLIDKLDFLKRRIEPSYTAVPPRFYEHISETAENSIDIEDIIRATVGPNFERAIRAYFHHGHSPRKYGSAEIEFSPPDE